MAAAWIEKRKGWLSGHNRQSKSPNKESDYGVIFIPLRCPRCHSKDVKCHTSRPPIRYHTCRKCGYKFKSIEADYQK